MSDAAAGIVVGLVALPLAIAFGIASGVSPEKGLVTAIIAGFLISALGGSRVQIGGPTGAFIVVVYGIIQKYGVDGLTLATLLAGVLLIVAGLAGLGTFIRYVPRPVVIGFTAGIALIIFSSQIRDMLGLPIVNLPAEFVGKWEQYLAHAGSTNIYAVLIFVGTVLSLLVLRRFFNRFPGSLAVIVLASAIVHFFSIPVETIASRFGALPHALPAPHLPEIHLEMVRVLALPAFTIALLAGIESLLSAVVADGMIEGKHRSNTELIAQGMANIGSSLFGGIPATGAIARTATNVRSGAKTPMAGILHALTLLLILIFFGRWAEWIPLSCLAGILTIVAYHMSEWRAFLSTAKNSRRDGILLIMTFGLTVFWDLTAAIAAGMVLSVLMRKAGRSSR